MTGESWLAVIAVSTAVIAVVQLGVVIAAVSAARDAARSVRELRQDLVPILANARQASEDAARMSALALTQVERIDALVTTTTARVEETMDVVQDAVHGSVQSGTAVLAGLRAALAFFSARQNRRSAGEGGDDEDDDSLFIG